MMGIHKQKLAIFEISREAGYHTVLWLMAQKNVTYGTSCKLETFLRKDLPQVVVQNVTDRRKPLTLMQ